MRKILLILLVYMNIGLFGIQNKSNLSSLRKNCLHNAKQDKSQYVSVICCAFNAINTLYRYKAHIKDYISSKDIKQIFEQDLFAKNSLIRDQYLKQAQQLIIAQLYSIIFQDIIDRSKEVLEELFYVKAYWEKELFKKQCSWSFFNNEEYIEEVAIRVEALKKLEKQISKLLGITTYGLSILSNIEFVNSIEDELLLCLQPLYEMLGKKVPASIEDMFHDQDNILYAVESEYTCIKVLLKDNDIPHHIVRYLPAYTCGAIGLLTTLLLYKTYENQVHEYIDQGKEALCNIKDYVIDSFWGFKEVLWDRKSKQLSQPKFEKFEFDESQKFMKISPLEFTDAEAVLNTPMQAHCELPVLSTQDLEKNAQVIKDQLYKALSTRDLILKTINDANPGWLVKSFIVGGEPGGASQAAVADWKEYQKQYLQNPHDSFEGFVQATIIIGLDEIAKLETYINNSMKKFESSFNKFINEFNALKKVTAQELHVIKIRANQLTETADDLEKFAKKVVKKFGKNYDKKMVLVEEGVEIFNDLLKKQSVTIGLTAIVPVLLGSYALYRSGFCFYNKSYYHTYIKPMREIIRDIDMLLNSVTHQNSRVFSVDGKLYYLVIKLRDYITCLESDELQKMFVDMQDLLSFDLNYMQKQQVVNRMYHTYEFLI